MTLVPRLLSIYHTYAVRFTNWENHSRQSTHDGSLTLKTFSLSAIVAYGGLALSAFVYVPFGEEVMTFVQTRLFHSGPSTASSWTSSVLSSIASGPTATAVKNATGFDFNSTTTGDHKRYWDTDHVSARSKLDPSRLQNQMFAITVTNQVVNTFLEIGLPYITRGIAAFRSGKGKGLAHAKNAAGSKTTNSPEQAQSTSVAAKEKRVAFEDDQTSAEMVKNANGKEEREFLEKVRREVGLPEYTLFADYSEMVTQFGYVALWSTIWPLAPGEFSVFSL